MASFESKVSTIFHEKTNLITHFPHIIQQLFHESERSFSQRIKNDENETSPDLTLLYDIAFMDYFYEDIDNWLLPWIIENYASEFTDDELGEMASQAASHLDYYQVLETQPGKGSLLRSIITEREFFLNDVSTSKVLTKWDIFLARCYPWESKYYATGAMKLFSPDTMAFISDQIAKEFEKYKMNFQDSNYAHFAKDRWDVFFQIERKILQKSAEKKIYTAFGEYDARDVIFKVHNLQAAMQHLMELEEFEYIKHTEKKDRKNKQKSMLQYQFEWLSCGQEEELEPIRTAATNGFINTVHQVDEDGNKTDIEYLGEFSIDSSLARLTVGSQELAKYAKNRIAKLLAPHVTVKRITKAQPSQQPSELEEPSKHLDEKTKAKIQEQFVQEYYANILDTEIPFLNNLTPKQARQDPKTLPVLIEWLKQFENSQLRNEKTGNIFIDVGRLKKELDITF